MTPDELKAIAERTETNAYETQVHLYGDRHLPVVDSKQMLADIRALLNKIKELEAELRKAKEPSEAQKDFMAMCGSPWTPPEESK